MSADLALLVGIARGHRLEIGAGAEIAAGAGEDSNRGVLVGIEGEERVVELSRRGAIDGVAAMRTVDGHDGHGAIAFDQPTVGLRHVAPLLFPFQLLSSLPPPRRYASR